MTILAIIILLVLALIAFKLIKGMVKLAVIAAIVLLGLFLVHKAGAF